MAYKSSFRGLPIDRKRRISESKPDLFSVTLAGKKNADGQGSESFSKKCYRLIVPELCAMTLLPNWRLMKIVTELNRFLNFKDKVGNAKSGLPKVSAQDEWISRLIQTSHLPDDAKNAKRRAAWRDSVIKDVADQPREHIAIRAFPVRHLVPQKSAKADNFLLLVAFHLTRGWFSAFICRMKPEYQHTHGKQVEQDKQADSKFHGPAATLGKRVVPERKWQEFLGQMKVAIGIPNEELGRVILHLPEDAINLTQSLSGQGWHVANDMPATYAGADRLVIQRRRAHKPILDRLQLPERTWGEDLAESRLDRLPNLTGLTHPEKNALIDRLWAELVELRAANALGSASV